MLTFRWFHHFKGLVILSSALFVVGSCAGIVWLNQRGFEGKWGERIAGELARHGIHAEFESVRFSPTRGIIAKKVLLFTDKSREEIFARIPVLQFDVDRGKAFRGELQIRRIILRDAHLSIPVASGGLALQVTNLTGRASLDRQNRLLLQADRGSLGGMNFHLELELDEFELSNFSSKDEESGSSSAQSRNEFATDLLSEVSHWSFPDDPPELRLRITGSMGRRSRIRTSFALTASGLVRRDYTMKNVRVAGSIDNRVLAIDELRFSDSAGDLEFHARYDLQDKRGAYDASSSIKIADLLLNGLDDRTLSEFLSVHAPSLEVSGEFDLAGEEGLRLNAIGRLQWESFRFLGIPLQNLDTEFSWQDRDIYLRELKVAHEAGKLSGDILVQGDLIRYRAKSSLPFSTYGPFIKEDSGLERVFAGSTFTDQSEVVVRAQGSIQTSNLREWDASGNFQLENFSYNGVPVALASADFEMTQLDSIFRNVVANFDYSSYERNRRIGGAPSGTLHAASVGYDATSKLTRIKDLEGTAWPGPVLRLFAPLAADHVEKHYGFRAPPHLLANGDIDHLYPPMRTSVETLVKTSGLTDYKFLGQTLHLEDLSATVQTRYRLHDVRDLRCMTLGGSLGGSLTVKERPNVVSGELKCSKLDLAQLAKKYLLAKPVPGSLNATVRFEAEETVLTTGQREWDVSGKTDLRSSRYNGVPIAQGTARFDVNSQGLSWTGIKAVFDYSNYVLKQRYDGPAIGTVQVDKIQYDRKGHYTDITNLRGTAWPGPMIRLVNPLAANHIDECYGFRKLPRFEINGRADHRKPARRTDLTSTLTADGTVDYEFLDKTLQLTEVSATVKTRLHRNEVSDLKFRTFRGTGSGSVTATTAPGNPTVIAGGVRWDNMSLGDITQKYEFGEEAKGTITGRIDFSTLAERTRTLNGTGVVGLHNGQLFHVPIFGPLSLPIGGVLGKQFSHEQARDASATFVIKNGVVFTKDFLTETPSTTFVGEGNIDLETKRIDLTMRMNARGLLGLVTLPLRPFNGLFQFRGQGPLKEPAWQIAPFTQPAEGRENPIFRDPPKAQIVPER